MSAVETEAAIDRVVAMHQDLGDEDFATYAVVVFALLATHAPEVVTFILDRADEKLARVAEAGRTT